MINLIIAIIVYFAIGATVASYLYSKIQKHNPNDKLTIRECVLYTLLWPIVVCFFILVMVCGSEE